MDTKLSAEITKLHSPMPPTSGPAGATETSPTLLVVCASLVGLLLAVVVFALNALAAAWGIHPVPKGDLCIIEANVRRALELEVLTGLYSRYGWHHPGPAYFYVLAPFYALFGPTHGIWIGAAVLSGASVAIAPFSWLALTRSPTIILGWGALALGVIFALTTSQLDRFAWTPVVAVCPYVLLVSLSFAVARGRWAWLPAGLLVHALLAQIHVGYLLTATATLAFGVVWGLAQHLRCRHGVPVPRATTAVLVAAAVVVAWLPPILEALRVGPSNLSKVISFFTVERHWEGTFSTEARHVAADALSRPIGGLVQIWTGEQPSETTRNALAIATLALPLAVIASGAARRSRAVLFLALSGIAQLLLVLVALRGLVGPPMDYLFFWVSGAALVPWMAGLAALGTFRERWLGSRRVNPLLTALIVMGFGALALRRGFALEEPLRWHSNYSRDANHIADEANRRLPRPAAVRVVGSMQKARSLATLLRRAGHSVSVARPLRSSAPAYDLVVIENPGEGAVIESAGERDVIGRWDSELVVLRPASP